jgi:hypothetical protein
MNCNIDANNRINAKSKWIRKIRTDSMEVSMNRVLLPFVSLLILVFTVSALSKYMEEFLRQNPEIYKEYVNDLMVQEAKKLINTETQDRHFAPNDTGLTYLSSVNWMGMLDFCTDGSYLYCAIFNGLIIFDISDPENPDSVGCLYFPQGSYHIDKYQDYVYLEQSSDGIAIVDVSDPANPDSVRRLKDYFSYSDIYVKSNFGYVLYGSSLIVYDLTDPAHPSELTSISLSEYGDYIHAEGNILYVVDYAGISIVDISDPINIVETGSIQISPSIREIDVDSNLLFIATSNYGTFIYDITDAENPDSLALFNTSGTYHTEILVKDGIGYVGGISSSCSFDYSDPENPVLLCNMSEFVHTYDLIGNYLVGIEYDGVFCFSLTDPTCPVVAGELELANATQDIWASTDYLYILESLWYFDIFDISDPVNPLSINSFYCGGLGYDLSLQENLAFVSPEYNYLLILDISNPLDLDTISKLSGWKARTFVQDTILYIAPTNSGLQIYEISDPYFPEFVSSPDSSKSAYQVVVQDTIAAVLEMDTSIHFYDISDPYQPLLLSKFKTDKTSYDAYDNSNSILLQDTLVIFTESSGSLWIINIADILNPVEIWSSTVYHGDCVANNDEILYVGDFSEIMAFDISNHHDIL